MARLRLSLQGFGRLAGAAEMQIWHAEPSRESPTFAN